MEQPAPPPEELEGGKVQKPVEGKEERRRAAKAFTITWLLIILLLLPLRADKYLWYAQNVSCLRCHTEMLAKFDEGSVHAPFKQQHCTICHREHTKVRKRQADSKNTSRWGRAVERFVPRFVREDIWNLFSPPVKSRVAGVKASAGNKNLIKPEEDLCLVCHHEVAEQLSMTYGHPPFNGRKCTGCHDPHASDFTSMTRKRADELCAVCHRMDADFARPVSHRPFQIRSCPSCHTGHASNYKGLLKTSQKEVCLVCHQGIVSQMSLPVQHRPFENGECTGCHKPHSSSASFLLIDRMPEVCYRCHGKTRADFERSSRHPVSATFTCMRCHEPHASNFSTLLFASGNEVCYRCHQGIKATFEVTKHSTINFDQGKGACLGCHVYHGSRDKPLLADEPIALCRRCHAQMFMAMNHPVGGDLYDARRNSTLTCTSTCHWVHYVPTKALLKWSPDDLCLNCHTGTGFWK